MCQIYYDELTGEVTPVVKLSEEITNTTKVHHTNS